MPKASNRQHDESFGTYGTHTCPHLPHHRQGAANGLGGTLGAVHRSRAALGADSETQAETSEKQIVPAGGLLSAFIEQHE